MTVKKATVLSYFFLDYLKPLNLDLGKRWMGKKEWFSGNGKIGCQPKL